MFKKFRFLILVKNLCFILVILTAIISCSKKVTGSKAVDTPMATQQKVAAGNTIVNANSNIKTTEPKKVEDAATAATEEKKKILMLAEGKEISEVKCGKCHDAHEPKEYNAAKWEKLIDWMGPRAKLETHEKEALLAYVKHNAKK